MAELDNYLKDLIDYKGSDLHLYADGIPVVKIYGKMINLEPIPLTARKTALLFDEILSPEQKEKLDKQKNIDFAHEVTYQNEIHRFRGHILFQKYGLNGYFRYIPKKIPSLRELNLPEEILTLSNYNHGLVLVTGPASCGKTTTLAALIDAINRKRRCHITTIEDPIEYIYTSYRSFVVQKQIGTHIKDYHTALLCAMRSDPDIIVINELRDLETIRVAIRAAETGHLVLTTLHTTNACQTIDRIIDSFPSSQQPQIRIMFSQSLRGIISQVLLPRNDKKGQIPAIEVLKCNLPIANLIREGKTYQIASIIQTGKASGMLSLDESLYELATRGKISPEDAFEYAVEKEKIEPLLPR